ncbi:MAG: hypothetical protein R3Y47_12110 [Lachnospiraceae bacterium]
MKSKKEFLSDFFSQLVEQGFVVETTDDVDIVAEVYEEQGLFCVIASDGEIIYEVADDNKIQIFEEAVKEIQQSIGVSTSPPYEPLDRLEPVALTRGTYFKLMESMNVIMLCRYNGVFGYEFVTCNKLTNPLTSKKYYREQISYTLEQAQQSFAERSNMKLATVSPYNHEELGLILSCLTRTIYIDSALDNKMESDIKRLIEKTERILPSQQEFSPRYYYEHEQ